jgi:hypothetical protein
LAAFPVVLVEENIHAAVQDLLQCHGLGGLRPNTVLLGWSPNIGKHGVVDEILRTTRQMQRSIVVVACKQTSENTRVREGAINIWWNSDANGALMLLLGFLLKKNPAWRNCALRIIRPIPAKGDLHHVAEAMQNMLTESRIVADLAIIPTDDPLESVRKVMEPSAVLLAGFDPAAKENPEFNAAAWQRMVDLPGDVLLVYSAGDVSLQA